MALEPATNQERIDPMGTVIFTTADANGKVLADEFAPYNVRMFTLNGDSAAVCVAVPVTEENRESLARVYEFTSGARFVYMAFVVKHEGTLSPRHRAGQARSVSIKVMSETMGPHYTGGANLQFMDTLTPLKDTDGAAYANAWRCKAYRNALAAA